MSLNVIFSNFGTHLEDTMGQLMLLSIQYNLPLIAKISIVITCRYHLLALLLLTILIYLQDISGLKK